MSRPKITMAERIDEWAVNATEDELRGAAYQLGVWLKVRLAEAAAKAAEGASK